MQPTRGIQYAPGDGMGGRGLTTMGGVSPQDKVQAPVAPKNGLAEPITGDEINAMPQDDNLLDRYATQPIPDSWPQ